MERKPISMEDAVNRWKALEDAGFIDEKVAKLSLWESRHIDQACNWVKVADLLKIPGLTEDSFRYYCYGPKDNSGAILVRKILKSRYLDKQFIKDYA